MIENKTISVVYKNKHQIPVNKQAVKEFHKDHECVAPDFTGIRPEYTVSRSFFKKATARLRDKDVPDLAINFVDYERICSAIKRIRNDGLPHKYRKLIRFIVHMAKCNQSVAILVIKKMESERFIKVHGDFVEYF